MSATTKLPSLDERVAAARDALSPAEERVVSFLVEHREEAVFLSAADIARRLDTSDATVIRAVQTLGYGGLPALKGELQDALRSRATPTLRLGRSLEDLGDDPDAILEHVLATELALIKDARETLRPSDFARAVELLASADRVVVQGVGPNASLAEYFALRLGRLRKSALAVTARGVGLADALLDMRRGDLAVAIVYERGTPEFEHVLDRAKELRLPSIIITDTLGFALAGRSTVALSARRAGSGMFHLSSITMVVIDALLMALAGRDRVRALDAYEDLQRLRARVAGH
ncbi:MAG: MurR/RpiR family transcriptional regulator [Chloroflexi bacterium]|nr:MAG: MurR/RpiR family transcriptional regulator [Chloroflexota bacterium]TMB80963.1 MAG: MurR/RpiR family transcriptional regulator [Chloroflexota bacterium]